MEECIHTKQHELKFEIIEGKLNSMPADFVYWKTFVWVVGICSTMIIGLGGMVMNNNVKVQNAEVEMAKIETKLESIILGQLELKALLKEHDKVEK